MEKNNYSNKVAVNTIYQIIGRVLITIIAFFTIGILTRYLGVTGFGEYSIVIAYLSLYAVIADFGFFYLIVRKLSAKEENEVEVASNLISIRTIAAIIIYGLSIIIVQFLPYSPDVKLAISFGTIAFLASSIANTVYGVLQVYFQMYWAVFADVLARSLILLFVFLITKSGGTLSQIIWAYVGANIVSLIVVIFRARTLVKFNFRVNLPAWFGIIKESLPFGVAIVFSFLYFKVDSLMLSILKGPTDVGIYAPGVKILEVVLTLPSLFIATILPIYSRYFAQKDSRLPATIQKSFDLLAVAMAGVVGGIFILAPQIIQLISGNEFLNASTVIVFGNSVTAVSILAIIIFTAASSYLSPTFLYLIIAAGKQAKLVVPNILFLIFNIVLNLIFIPRYSYFASAWITVATDILVLIVVYYLAKREVNFNLSFVRLFKSILASLVMVIILSQLHLPILVEILIGAICYLGLAYILGAIRPEVFSLIKFRNE